MHHEFSKTIKHIKNQYQAGFPLVMATVLKVHGSSYRREGARMLVNTNGQISGQISGGCLEGDILKKAKRCLDESVCMVVTYDTRKNENEPLKAALGCNGVIDILIEPVTQALIDWASEIETCFEHDQQATSRLTIRTLNGISEIQRELIQQNPNTRYDTDLTEAPNQLTLIETIPLRKHLAIWGGGPDVLPIIQLAQMLNWRITVASDDMGFLAQQNLQGVTTLESTPEKPFAATRLHSHTALLLASHSYPRDKAVLAATQSANLPYVGIMGPKFRGAQMLDEVGLETQNQSLKTNPNYYYPTGLNIGSDTPAEIALSILAEIQAVFNNKPQPDYLRNSKKAMHPRREGEVETISETTVNTGCTIRLIY